jgi:hypothetical protein
MPSSDRVFIQTKSLLERRRRLTCAVWKRVDAPFNLALEQCSPRLLIIDEKEIRVEFKENIIIRSNMMNGCKILKVLWNMENIV